MIALLLTCELYRIKAMELYTEASLHNAENRVISEYNTQSQANYLMMQYRKCKGTK